MLTIPEPKADAPIRHYSWQEAHTLQDARDLAQASRFNRHQPIDRVIDASWWAKTLALNIRRVYRAWWPFQLSKRPSHERI